MDLEFLGKKTERDSEHREFDLDSGIGILGKKNSIAKKYIGDWFGFDIFGEKEHKYPPPFTGSWPEFGFEIFRKKAHIQTMIMGSWPDFDFQTIGILGKKNQEFPPHMASFAFRILI